MVIRLEEQAENRVRIKPREVLGSEKKRKKRGFSRKFSEDLGNVECAAIHTLELRVGHNKVIDRDPGPRPLQLPPAVYGQGYRSSRGRYTERFYSGRAPHGRLARKDVMKRR